MKLTAIIHLIVIVGFTVGLAAQPISTVDAVQNLEISRTQDSVVTNSKRIDALAASVEDLSASVNRGIGIGIGIGLTMTLLQIVTLVSGRRNDGPKLKDRY